MIKIRGSCAYVKIQKKYYLYVYIHVNDVLTLAFFYRINNNLKNLINVEKLIQNNIINKYFSNRFLSTIIKLVFYFYYTIVDQNAHVRY